MKVMRSAGAGLSRNRAMKDRGACGTRSIFIRVGLRFDLALIFIFPSPAFLRGRGQAALFALLSLRKSCRLGEGASSTTGARRKPLLDYSDQTGAEKDLEAGYSRSTLTRASQFAQNKKTRIAPRDLSHGKMWEREFQLAPADEVSRRRRGNFWRISNGAAHHRDAAQRRDRYPAQRQHPAKDQQPFHDGGKLRSQQCELQP